MIDHDEELHFRSGVFVLVSFESLFLFALSLPCSEVISYHLVILVAWMQYPSYPYPYPSSQTAYGLVLALVGLWLI